VFKVPFNSSAGYSNEKTFSDEGNFSSTTFGYLEKKLNFLNSPGTTFLVISLI
jgi:hypothetical protein